MEFVTYQVKISYAYLFPWVAFHPFHFRCLCHVYAVVDFVYCSELCSIVFNIFVLAINMYIFSLFQTKLNLTSLTFPSLPRFCFNYICREIVLFVFLICSEMRTVRDLRNKIIISDVQR